MISFLKSVFDCQELSTKWNTQFWRCVDTTTHSIIVNNSYFSIAAGGAKCSQDMCCFSIPDHMDCSDFILAIVFFFHPLSSFFIPWRGSWLRYIISMSQFAASTNLFLAATSSTSSQVRLLPTCSRSVLIFTRLGNTGTCKAWRDVSVMLGSELTLVQD